MKIIKSKYYIIDLRNLEKPAVFSKPFATKRIATRALKKLFDKVRFNFDILLGEDVIYYDLNRKAKGGKHLSKYDYPEWCTTWQQKKTYRTMQRYHIRPESNGDRYLILMKVRVENYKRLGT